MSRLRLEVVTPERTVLTGEAESVMVPGMDGYIGFMSHHAPLVAGLTVGIVAVWARSGRKGSLPSPAGSSRWPTTG